MAGSTSRQTLTINGSNFVNGATLTFDPPTGSNITSFASWLSFNSSTRITYQINNDNDPGTWQVRVTNPDGKTSGWSSFTVTAPATPSPSITSVSPNPVTGSNSAQSFTINGSNFQSGPNVILRDKRTGETFSNRTISSFATNRIVVNPTFTTMAATWSVEVVNPDGKSTGQFNFTVNAPATPTPSISSVSPFSVPASSSDQALTISGSNFVSGATLTFDPPTGSDIASSASKLTFVSSSQIRYQINNDNDAGTWRVRVTNPDGKLSGWANFTVAAPTGPGGFTLSHDPPYWDERSPAGPAVMLRWTHSSGATSYDIYRNGALVKASLNALKFTNDLGLVAGQSYTYHVVAKNSDGNRQSNVLSIGPMSGVPVTAPRPDLIVVPGSITFPQSSLTSGQQFALSFSIKNNGPGPAPKTTARLRLSMDNQLTSRDAPLSPLDVEIPALASGQAYGFSGPIQVPSSTAQGQYFVGVFADAAGIAGQSDETNDARLSSARLTVSKVAGVQPPVITKHPSPAILSLPFGGTLDLDVRATGSGRTYQWMRNNAPIAEQQSDRLVISGLSKENEGEYFVRVSNSADFRDSSRVNVTVGVSPDEPESPPGIYNLYGDFNPEWPTVVITHGWQPSGAYGPTPYWMVSTRNAIKARRSDVNVLSFTWKDAHSKDPWTGPYSRVASNGSALAELLESKIAPRSYGGTVHFVGHSFGTFVNTFAVKNLTAKFPNLTIDQFTILDAPIDSGLSFPLGNPVLNSFFQRHLPIGKINYVDNYIATLPSRVTIKNVEVSMKLGNSIPGTAPNNGGYFAPNVSHETIHNDYYALTIPENNNKPYGFNNSIIINPLREWVPWSTTTYLHVAKERSVDAWNTLEGWAVEQGDRVGAKLSNVFRMKTNAPPSPFEAPTESLFELTSPPAEEADSGDAKVEFDLTVPTDADLLAFDFLVVEPGNGDWLSVTFNGEPLYVFRGDSFFGTEYHEAEAPVARFAGRAGVLSVTLHSESDEVAEVRVANFKFLTLSQQSAPRSLSRPTNLRVVRSSSSGSLTRVTLSVRDNSIGETSLAFWKQEKREGRGWKPWRRAKSLRGNFSTGTIRSSFTVPRRALHRFRASVTDGRTILNSNYIRHKSR